LCRCNSKHEHQEQGLIMRITPRPVGSANRHPEVSAPTADYSTRVIDLFRVFHRLSAESQPMTQEAARGHHRAVIHHKYSVGLVSRLERTFHSLIPLVAIVSLLLGIICLAKFATSRTISADQDLLAGRDVPGQGLVTFGQAMQQLGARH